MSRKPPPGHSLWRTCKELERLLREIDESVVEPRHLNWFREQAEKAQELQRQGGKAEARRRDEIARIVKQIVADREKGLTTYTGKEPPEDGRDWSWQAHPHTPMCTSDHPELQSTGTSAKWAAKSDYVQGWFPVEKPLGRLEETIVGLATALALLHDYCLCDVLEPENKQRILDDPGVAEKLRWFHILLHRLLDDGKLDVDWFERKWALVQREMHAATAQAGGG